MTINRHPLQSIGIGQNSRMLPDEAVVPYCDSLGERLGWLANALAEEQKEGRLSIAAAKAATNKRAKRNRPVPRLAHRRALELRLYAPFALWAFLIRERGECS